MRTKRVGSQSVAALTEVADSALQQRIRGRVIVTDALAFGTGIFAISVTTITAVTFVLIDSCAWAADANTDRLRQPVVSHVKHVLNACFTGVTGASGNTTRNDTVRRDSRRR